MVAEGKGEESEGGATAALEEASNLVKTVTLELDSKEGEASHSQEP